MPAVRRAAALARALDGRVTNLPKADEPTPAKAAVTEADLAVQEELLEAVAPGFARARLDAEEQTPSVAAFTGEDPDTRVVLDPIDGTLHFFLERRGPYAIMIGLARGGRYEAAVIALPREELLLQAVRGCGARVGTERGEPVKRPAPARRILVCDTTPEPVCRRLVERGYEIVFGSGGVAAIAPLVPGHAAGLRISRTGAISLRGRIGAFIAREANLAVRTLDGEAFPPDIDAPASSLLTAVSPAEADAVRSALTRTSRASG